MNIFPCKNCLVKVNCSEYCDKLEKEPQVIDMYVASRCTCPDCGSLLNGGSQFSKTSRICFDCSKVFKQESFLRKLRSREKLIGFPRPIVISKASSLNLTASPNLIVDIGATDPPELMPPTMEETHIVLYNRLSIAEAKYVISVFNESIQQELLKKPKPDVPNVMNLPSWINDYNPIGVYDIEGKKPGPTILK